MLAGGSLIMVNTDFAITVVAIGSLFIGYIIGHIIGMTRGIREGIIRGRIQGRNLARR
jgi:hypothetical protein